MSKEKKEDLKGKDKDKRDEIPDAELDKVAGGLSLDAGGFSLDQVPGLAPLVPVKGKVKVKLKTLASIL